MIESISFPKKGKGYIYKKYDPPGKEPNLKDSRYRTHDYDSKTHKFIERYREKDYEKDHKRWEDEVAFYNEHKGQYVAAGAAKNLIGRTFTFKPGVNVIFGPNGSGKTTILKALAGNAICKDGFSEVLEPTELSKKWDEKAEIKHVLETIEKLKQNSCNVVWSGNPIYYDNFANRQTYGELGNLVGSVFTTFEEEISWYVGGNRISAGQKTVYLLNKILRKLESSVSLQELVEPCLKTKANDTWVNCFKACVDYFKTFPDYSTCGHYTLIFDEMDKSLDIETVIDLYKNVLPTLARKYDCQIITVSHSPILLSPYFRNSKEYNIIDVDKEYSQEMIIKMNELYVSGIN